VSTIGPNPKIKIESWNIKTMAKKNTDFFLND
jgi:hypothetical protein